MKSYRLQFFIRNRTQDSCLIILALSKILIKTLIDRMHRINSTVTSFDIHLKNLKQVLLKNQYPLSMIDNVIKKYLQNTIDKMNTESMSVEKPNIEAGILNFLS